MSQIPRHPVFREDGQYVDQYPGRMHRVYLAAVIERGIPDTEIVVLMALCYHQDILAMAGEKGTTYADDIRRLVGYSAEKANRILRVLTKANITRGSAQAGYELAI
jgi:hypothetical protein